MPVCSLYIAVRAQASDNRHSLRPRAMNKHKSSGAASPNPEYAARKESPSFSNRNLVSGATLLFWRQFWRHFWHQCCFCPPGANFGVSFGVIFGANFGAKAVFTFPHYFWRQFWRQNWRRFHIDGCCFDGSFSSLFSVSPRRIPKHPFLMHLLLQFIHSLEGLKAGGVYFS